MEYYMYIPNTIKICGELLSFTLFNNDNEVKKMREYEEKSLLSIARQTKRKYNFAPIFKPQSQINGIHDIVRPIIMDAKKRMYKDMNEYMENIFNAPSTINRIMRYYHQCNIMGDDKEYIGFVNGDNNIVEIIREYDLDKYIHAEDVRQRLQLWIDSSLVIHEPNIICHISRGD